MVLPTMRTTPSAEERAGEQDHTPQDVEDGMQPLHPFGVELHRMHIGDRGDRCLQGVRARRRARRQRRRDDQRIRQGIVGQRIERLAEPGIAAKFGERLLGGDDAHRGDIAALAQLLGQLPPSRFALALLSMYTDRSKASFQLPVAARTFCQQQIEQQRQGERHRDHAHGHQGCKWLPRRCGPTTRSASAHGARNRLESRQDAHGGLPCIRDPAVAQDDAARAELLDEVHIVRGDHHRHADLVEALE